MTEEEKLELYERQVETLRTFLERGAISEAQFSKSYNDLTAKMFPDGKKTANNFPFTSGRNI